MNAGERGLFFGTNTKMTKGLAETVRFVAELDNALKALDTNGATVFAIPSFVALSEARKALDGSRRLLLGAQNVCAWPHGAYTGETSIGQLCEVGVDIVEIGHSERRTLFGETNEACRYKAWLAAEAGKTALLCVGETESERAAGLASVVLAEQVSFALTGMAQEQWKHVWIAYEPVWAIGENGVPASAAYAQQMHATMRKTIADCIGEEAARKIPLLYGGSVNAENIEELIGQRDIDGVFVGRAAWEAKGFISLLEQAIIKKGDKKV